MHRVSWQFLGLIAFTALWNWSGISGGEVLQFEYEAEVQYVDAFSKLFGKTVPDFSPVVGRLQLDTTAAASHDLGNGRIGYRQNLANGLTALIDHDAGQVHVAASEYLVIIGNDVDIFGDVVDTVEFLYSVDLTPSLASPLLIDGTPCRRGDYNEDGVLNSLDFDRWKQDFGQPSMASDGNGNLEVDAADYTVWRDGGNGGFLWIAFQTADRDMLTTSALSTANLRTRLNLGNFAAEFNPVGTNSFSPNAYFTLSALSLQGGAAAGVPEPSGLLSVLIGLWLVGCSNLLRHRWSNSHVSPGEDSP